MEERASELERLGDLAISGNATPHVSTRVCRCAKGWPVKHVECPLCREPAVWCSLQCAAEHLTACAVDRDTCAQSVRITMPQGSFKNFKLSCANCQSTEYDATWFRCAVCYEVKWCSVICKQADKTSHIQACIDAAFDRLKLLIAQAPASTDQNDALLRVPRLTPRHPWATSRCLLREEDVWCWSPGSCVEQDAHKATQSLVAHVVKLSETSKARLLDTSTYIGADAQSEATRILTALNNLNAAVRDRFTLKSQSTSNFAFRLLLPSILEMRQDVGGHPNQRRFDLPLGTLKTFSPIMHEDATSLEHAESFIAVSYCWHGPDWSLHENLTDLHSPLSLEMWHAVLNARHSMTEGIWIDQLCIDQKDEDEKQHAIAVMNLVYASARVVYICLDDISVINAEADLLVKFDDLYFDKNIVEVRQRLSEYLDIVIKVFSARWFTRAWCVHEHLSCRTAEMLIPLSDKTGFATVPMRALIQVFNWITEQNYDLMSDPRYSNLRQVLKQMLATSSIHGPTASSASSLRNYSEIWARCSALGASVKTDIMAVALNIIGLGLSFDARGLTLDDCYYAYALMSICAGDLTSICNTGPPVSATISAKSPFLGFDGLRINSWMQQPLLKPGDLESLAIPRTEDAEKLLQAPSFQQVHMDLITCDGHWTWARYSDESLAKTEAFLETSVGQRILSVFRDDPSSSQTLRHRLALVLDCGPLWIHQVFTQIMQPNSAYSPLQYPWYDAENPHWTATSKQNGASLDLIDLGSAAARMLFPDLSNTPSDRDMATPLVWMILFCHQYNHKALLWRLVDKSGFSQALCDWGPVPLANMRICMPEFLAPTQFSFFDRLWVGSFVDLRSGRPQFSPKIKMTAIGFCDLGRDEAPGFRKVSGAEIVSSKVDVVDSTGLVAETFATLLSHELPTWMVLNALSPDRQYATVGPIHKQELVFMWP